MLRLTALCVLCLGSRVLRRAALCAPCRGTRRGTIMLQACAVQRCTVRVLCNTAPWVCGAELHERCVSFCGALWHAQHRNVHVVQYRTVSVVPRRTVCAALQYIVPCTALRCACCVARRYMLGAQHITVCAAHCSAAAQCTAPCSACPCGTALCVLRCTCSARS